MTSILSTISGYFSKPLILSSFLPVIIFVILSWLLLVPILPPYAILQPLEGFEKEWKVLAVTLIAIVASGLIYNLNIQILRFYEGYPWRYSWIGRIRTNRFKKEFELRQARVTGLRVLLRAMDAASNANNPALLRATIRRLRKNGVSVDEIDGKDRQWLQMWLDGAEYQTNLIKERWKRIYVLVLNEYTRMTEELKRQFPEEDWLILPTRLGNVIRCFEYYSKREYRIDATEMWPRLVAAMDKEYATLVDDAKSSCDFFITSSMLSGILSAIFFVVAFMRPVAITGRTVLFTTLGKGVVFAFLAYALYLLAIPRAQEWGKTVRSAFDIYRWKLVSELGYKQELTTRSAERELWKEISRQTIYGDSFVRKAPLDYVDEKPIPTPSAAHGGPSTLQLEIARGVQLTDQPNKLTIFLRIKNTDANQAVNNIVVTDKIPDGFHYEWGSAASDLGDVVTSGTNPYKFAIAGPLNNNQPVTLTYRVISLTSNQIHNVGLRLGRV